MTFDAKIDQIMADILDDPGFNTEVAAKQLDLKPQTLSNWRHQRRGPVYHKIGGRVVYKKSDLDRFLAAGRIDPESRD